MIGYIAKLTGRRARSDSFGNPVGLHFGASFLSVRSEQALAPREKTWGFRDDGVAAMKSRPLDCAQVRLWGTRHKMLHGPNGPDAAVPMCIPKPSHPQHGLHVPARDLR